MGDKPIGTRAQAPDLNVTAEILATQRTLTEHVTAHSLQVHSCSYAPASPGGRHWNRATGDSDIPVLASAEVTVFGEPVEFLRWAESLRVDDVIYDRTRVGETYLYLHAYGVNGIDWSVASSIPHREHGGSLSGVKIAWGKGRREARLPVADLRTGLAGLGMAVPALGGAS